MHGHVKGTDAVQQREDPSLTKLMDVTVAGAENK